MFAFICCNALQFIAFVYVRVCVGAGVSSLICLPSGLSLRLDFLYFLFATIHVCMCVFAAINVCQIAREQCTCSSTVVALYIYIYVCVAVWLFIFSCKPLSAFVDLFDLQKLKGSETEVENKEISLKI